MGIGDPPSVGFHPIADGGFRAVAGVLLAGLVFWRWFFSRPHLFKDHDGNFHTWHPGDRFTDANNRAVTDPERIASLKKAWRDAYTADP